jgi:hypothetical protein
MRTSNFSILAAASTQLADLVHGGRRGQDRPNEVADAADGPDDMIRATSLKSTIAGVKVSTSAAATSLSALCKHPRFKALRAHSLFRSIERITAPSDREWCSRW